MGQRTSTESLAAIYQAFLTHRTWKQVDLAEEVGIRPDAIRRVLGELQLQGMPLTAEKDHPHVFWSVPKNWFPGSVLFKQEEVPELLRQIRRIPKGPGRERLLALLLDRLPKSAVEKAAAPEVVVVREPSPAEAQFLSVVEDAGNQHTALQMRYLNAGRVEQSTRHASVHRVLLGPPARFIATCHRDGRLKTFRVDGILDAHLDSHAPFRPADKADLARYVSASVDGFHDEGLARELSFFVRDPDARWVQKNLPEGMRAESTVGGSRVTANTSAVRQVARFVVGLGSSATPESPDLAAEVEGLARGALKALETRE